MTANELAEALADLLRAVSKNDEDDPTELHDAQIQPFHRAGVMTTDAGFVVELADGAEYKVTIMQSRNAHHEEAEDDGDDMP